MKTCLYYVKIRLHRSYVHANIGLSMFLKHALMKYPVFWRKKHIEKLAFERRKGKRVQRLFLVCVLLSKNALQIKRMRLNALHMTKSAFMRAVDQERCVKTQKYRLFSKSWHSNAVLFKNSFCGIRSEVRSCKILPSGFSTWRL
jgi:hypothetical protein